MVISNISTLNLEKRTASFIKWNDMGVSKNSYKLLYTSIKKRQSKIGTENAFLDYMFVTETRMAVGEEVIEVGNRM